MKMKKIITAVSCSVGVLALVSCSTTPRNGTGAPVTDVNGGSVTTSGYGTQAGFAGTDKGSRLRAPANQSYYFDLNSNAVHQEDYPSISAQAGYLSSHANSKVRVEGHCDNRGSREYNVALGWRRANAVKSILAQNGAAPNQVTTFSWGAEKQTPQGGQSQEAWWAKNRRVDLVYKSY